MPSLIPPIPANQVPADEFSRAHALCLAAQDAARVAAEGVAPAALAVAQSREQRIKRTASRRLWYDLRQDPERLLVTCAYCGDVRTSDGSWVSGSAEVSQTARGRNGFQLSHGICPDCLGARRAN